MFVRNGSFVGGFEDCMLVGAVVTLGCGIVRDIWLWFWLFEFGEFVASQ